MKRYVQAQVGHFRVLLDCQCVQEVGEWQQGLTRRRGIWREQTLPVADMAAVLGTTHEATPQYLVLDTRDEAQPRIILLVSSVTRLVDMPEGAFQTPLAQPEAQGLYDAAHDPASGDILLRLHPSALPDTLHDILEPLD